MKFKLSNLDGKIGRKQQFELFLKSLFETGYSRHAAAQVDTTCHFTSQVHAARLDGFLDEFVDALTVQAPNLRVEEAFDCLESSRFGKFHFSFLFNKSIIRDIFYKTKTKNNRVLINLIYKHKIDVVISSLNGNTLLVKYCPKK